MSVAHAMGIGHDRDCDDVIFTSLNVIVAMLFCFFFALCGPKRNESDENVRMDVCHGCKNHFFCSARIECESCRRRTSLNLFYFLSSIRKKTVGTRVELG